MSDYEIKLIGELLGAGVPVFYGHHEIVTIASGRIVMTGERYRLLSDINSEHITYIALTRCRLDEKAIPVKKNRKKLTPKQMEIYKNWKIELDDYGYYAATNLGDDEAFMLHSKSVDELKEIIDEKIDEKIFFVLDETRTAIPQKEREKMAEDIHNALFGDVIPV